MQLQIQTCPLCGAVTDCIYDYRLQRGKNMPIQGKKLIWHYWKRRYWCDCCAKWFYESNYLLPKWHRITNRLSAYCLSLLTQKRSLADIARSLGVSSSAVDRWLQLLGFSKPERLPRVLSVDEFRGNTEWGKFQCILTAPKEKASVDIFPTRYTTDISDYFCSFPNWEAVKYVVMNMNKDYFSVAKRHFPNAWIVIDCFHVVCYCTWVLENWLLIKKMKLFN